MLEGDRAAGPGEEGAMSRSRKATRVLVALAVVMLVSLVRAAAPPQDKVTLRDGSTFACRVLELDARRALVEREGGAQQSIARAELVRIEFGQTPAVKIVARVHVVEADDIVRIKLDGREVASPAELRAGWVDLVPLLADGPNVLEAEVENHSGPWAYRWTIEAGADKATFACGLAGKTGCRENGASGQEKGNMPAGRVYIYVHRDSGEVTLQK